MTDPQPSPPSRAPSPAAVGALVLGVLVALTSGVCTGGFLIASGGDAAGYGPAIAVVALILGVPVILAGVGLIALGMRLRDPTPGPPPLWHAVVGWILMIVAGLVALGHILSVGSMLVGMGPLVNEVGGADVAGMIGAWAVGAIIPLGLCALVIWLGLTLTRPRR